MSATQKAAAAAAAAFSLSIFRAAPLLNFWIFWLRSTNAVNLCPRWKIRHLMHRVRRLESCLSERERELYTENFSQTFSYTINPCNWPLRAFPERFSSFSHEKRSAKWNWEKPGGAHKKKKQKIKAKQSKAKRKKIPPFFAAARRNQKAKLTWKKEKRKKSWILLITAE